MNADLKYSINFVIKIYSVLFLTGETCLSIATWFLASLHGGHYIVYTNRFGEQAVEIWMIVIVFPIVLYGVLLIVNEMIEDRRKRRLIKLDGV